MTIVHPKNQGQLFHHDIKWIIVIAQIFGMFPVRGITSGNVGDLVFTWHAKRVFLSVFVILGSAFVTTMSFYGVLFKQRGLHAFSSFIFNANSAVGGIIFFHLAKNWPQLIKNWSKVETSMEHYCNNKSLSRRFNVLMLVIMSAAAVEHLLSIIHVSNEIPDDNPNKYEAYFVKNYPHIFDFFEFSVPLAIFVVMMNICNVFSWNFLDAFLMIVSISLSHKFSQVTEKVIAACKTKMRGNHQWIKLREDYNKISVLCKTVNKHISWLILVSFGTNMFFIMAQLYWSLKHKTTTLESVYFSFSFGLLVLRTVAVTLFSSNINDESKKSMSHLLSLNSDTYSSEIERFAFQIHCQPVALTGSDFFTITRGLLFGMAGTIVTYELFLIQSDVAFSY